MAIQTERLQAMFVSDSRIMMETLRRIVRAAAVSRLSEEQIDRAFRAAHSLKSEAGFLQLEDITTTAHSLEDVLTTFRDQGGDIDPDDLARLKSGVAILETKLDGYYAHLSPAPEREESQKQSKSIAAVASARVASGSDGESRAGSPAPGRELRSPVIQSMLREAQQRGEHVYRVSLRIDTVPELAYPRAFLAVNNLELGCAVVLMHPSLDELGTSTNELQLLLTSADSEQMLRKRVHVDEVVITGLSQPGYDELLEQTTPQADGSGSADGMESASNVSHEELSLLGEVLGQEAAVLLGSEPLSSEQRQRAHTRISRVSRYLKHRSPGVPPVQLLDRLRPVRGEMERYADERTKRVRIRIGGGGALVSPAIADVVTEMAIHLVRNSIDHGIEPRPARIKSGKRPTGIVAISVSRLQGGDVVLEVSDDGRGVDEPAVRARAGEESTALFDLLATPGFTTTGEPTLGSGRGVGLDAVRHSAVRLLGGSVTMDNRPGKGVTTKVRFSHESRLMTVELVRYAHATFAVPQAVVVRNEALSSGGLKRDSFGAVFYEVDGSPVPVITPQGRSPRVDKLDPNAQALICRGPDGPVVVAVDSRVGIEAVVRDGAGRRTVYSRTSGTEAQLVIPGIA